MAEKLITKEIIKALGCCGEFGSFICDENCPMFGSKYKTVSDCRLKLHKLSLDLINRQQAEIENYSHNIKNLTEENLQLHATIKGLQKLLYSFLDTRNGDLVQITNTELEIIKKPIKSEAIKEFAKDIHEEICKALDNNYKVRNQRIERNLTDKLSETCDVFVQYVEGKIDALRGVDVFVCDYVIEMVGEQE